MSIIIKKENCKSDLTNEKMVLDYNDLDFGFGIGDYYYNGKCNGSQIGFCWVEELGQEYVEHLYFVAYYGDEDESDLYTLHKTLKNLTPNEKLVITLSSDDYETFRLWFMETERETWHYYNKEEIKFLENYKNS